jgi:hypothetical protein
VLADGVGKDSDLGLDLRNIELHLGLLQKLEPTEDSLREPPIGNRSEPDCHRSAEERRVRLADQNEGKPGSIKAVGNAKQRCLIGNTEDNRVGTGDWRRVGRFTSRVDRLR